LQIHVRNKRCYPAHGDVSCNCATAFREGNNILGVYACDIGKPPVAMRYLVDDKIPGVIRVDKSGKKFKVGF